jgi:methionyl-tRNA formyltransferase
MSLRLVFAGTPEFAVPSLAAAFEGPDTLLAIYTQPDRPAGRGRQAQASAVKQFALRQGIAVRQPDTLRDVEARAPRLGLTRDVMIGWA